MPPPLLLAAVLLRNGLLSKVTEPPLPPLMSVKLAQFRRAQAEKELAEAIHAARDAKISWRELGEAIGTSGEAVRQRYAS